MSVERAATLMDLSRPEEALRVLAEAGDEALTARAHGLRAQALLSLGRLKEAEQAAGQARATAPSWEWGYRLGSIVAMRRGSLHKARELALEAVRLDPHEPLTHQVLTITLINLGDLGEARIHSEEMRRLAPDLALSYETHGRVLLAQGFYGEAQTALRTALELDPQDADCMSLLAQATEGLGDAHAARGLRLNALRSDPQSADRQRDMLRFGGAAALGGVFLVGKIGLLGKMFAFNGVVQGGRLAADDDGGNGLGHILLIVALLAYVAAFTVTRFRRRRHGKRLPPRVWEGLRPHRRNSNLLWLAWPSGLGLMGGLMVAPFSRGSALTRPLAVAGVGAALLALCWMSRGGAARERLLRQQLGDLAVVARVVASRTLGSGTKGQLGDPPLPGPAIYDRWRRGAIQVGAVIVTAVVLGSTFGAWSVLPGMVLVAGLLAAVVDRFTFGVSGVPYRICMEGTTVPASRLRLAIRALLRLLLLPAVALQSMGRADNPVRLVHDRLTGTTVTGLSRVARGNVTP